jgi:hypothetical protein
VLFSEHEFECQVNDPDASRLISMYSSASVSDQRGEAKHEGSVVIGSFFSDWLYVDADARGIGGAGVFDR